MLSTQKNKLRFTNQQGSTLIGVALMTLVMGFLMTGGIFLLKTYDTVQTDIESSEKTADLQAALKKFIGIHKRYPCPAPMDVAPDAPGFGVEDCTNPAMDVSGRDSLGVKIGAAPVRTLNVPDHLIVDGFGKRHIYAVTTDMTNPATADVVNGLGAITIMHEANGHTETLSDIEGYVVYTLISPGKDDRGAYDINGKEILPCDDTAIAGHNCDMADATFYTTLTQSVGNSTDFTHNFAFAANSPAYYWYTGPWSECANKYRSASVTDQREWNGSSSHYSNTAAAPECFNSFQEREVVCKDKQGTVVANTNCSHTAEPEDYRACSIDECEWDVEQPSCPSTIGGCGNGLMVDYNHICLDYKDRKTGLGVCDSYISRIGNRPMPLPRRNCPQRCCTQTHYDHEGNVLNTTPKVVGTCTDTYADPPPPADPPPEVIDDPTCGSLPAYEYETRNLGCDPGQSGANLQQERRSQEYDANCDVVRGSWEPTSNNINTCRDPDDPPPITCIETNTHDGVSTTVEKAADTCNDTTTCTPSSISETRPGTPISCAALYPNGPFGMSNWVQTTGFIPTTEGREIRTNADCSNTTTNWVEISRESEHRNCWHEGDRGVGGDE